MLRYQEDNELHLDFHGTFENYLKAKSKLFEMIKEDGYCVINADDPVYEQVKSACNGQVVSYGIQNNATYRADDIQLGIEGTTFNLIYDEKSYPVRTNLVALYNIYNLLAAIAALHKHGFELEKILEKVEVASGNQYYASIDDALYTKDGKLVRYLDEKKVREVLAVCFGSKDSLPKRFFKKGGVKNA